MALSKKFNSPKILIIGLDGACPQYLFDLAARGKLPSLQRLIQNGASGTLLSTIPPLTPTAWTSFMTGVNPGNHGLFDFIELLPQSYGIRFTNVKSRKVPSIWKIFNEKGYRVGVYNVPMTYPPEEVQGFLISGLDTPHKNSPFVWPPSLKKELLNTFGDIPLDPRHLGFMRSDTLRRKVLREIREIEELRSKIFLWLLKKFQPEIAMIVFTATDTVQHFFWHYADPKHSWYPGSPNEFSMAIEDIYIFVDQLVGLLLTALTDSANKTHIVIMSDHGFGPTSRFVFYPNRFLRRLKLLHLKQESTYLSRMDNFLRRVLPPWIKTRLSSWIPILRVWWEKKASVLSEMDWKNTKAFAVEILAIPLGFWINSREVFPQGVVKDALEYEKVVKTIIGELRKLEIRAFHRDEVYRGPYIQLAPDIVIDWWEDGLVFGRSFPAPIEAPIIEEHVARKDRPAEWSGTHRREGIFIFCGPQIKPGLNTNAEMEDIAPTIFSLLGESIPAHFEGRILEEIMTKVFKQIEYNVSKNQKNSKTDTETTYSDKESEAIQRKLKSLGYL